MVLFHYDFRIKPLNEQDIRVNRGKITRPRWSSALMDWLIHMKTYYASPFKDYLDLMVRNIHGLVIFYYSDNTMSPKMIGYGFRVEAISQKGEESNLVYYECVDQKDSFLEYAQKHFPTKTLLDDLPVAKTLIGCKASSSSKIVKPTTLFELKRLAREQFDLVFKTFSQIKRMDGRLKYVTLCETTPMGTEVGTAVYDPSNKAMVSLECLENQTVPALLIHYLTLELGAKPHNIPAFYRKVKLSSQPLTFTPTPTFQLILDVTLRYEPDLAGAGHELPHSINVYPTQGYYVGEKGGVVVDTSELNPETDALDTDARLVFEVSKNFIPKSVMLNFDVYATYMLKTGQGCINQAGYLGVNLAKLVTEGELHEVELTVPTSEQSDSVKGRLSVQVHSCNLEIKNKAHATSEETLSTKQSLILDYVETNRTFYHKHPASNPSIDNVTVFLFKTRNIHIPGSLFDVFRLPVPREDYFINVLMISYQRRLTLEDVGVGSVTPEQWMTEASPKLKVLTVMDMLAVFVNYCTYQTDEIDHNKRENVWRKSLVEKTESFDDIMPRMNGDCEDFSKQILREVMMLKYGQRYFVTEIILKHVIPTLHEFIFVSGLAGVSAKAISGASAYTTSLNGHECVYAIPNYIFFEALSRNTPRDYPLMNLYSGEERYAGADRAESIYVLEGTGNLFPEPRSKAHRWMMVESDFSACEESDKIMDVYIDMVFYSPEGPDNFYKMIITMLTPEFYYRWGFPVFEFLLVRAYPSLLGVGYQRGVEFAELLHIYNNKDVGIVPCPEIPSEVLKVSLSVHDNDYPPLTLVKPPITDEMRQVAESLTFGEAKGPAAFTFQIRFADMTYEIIRNIREIALKKNYSVKCDIEPVHQAEYYHNRIFGGFNISFY